MQEAENPLESPNNFIEQALNGQSVSTDVPYAFISGIWSVYSLFALIAAGFFIFGIIYAYSRTNQLLQIQQEQLDQAHALWKELHGGAPKNARWRDVEQHLDSSNPNDWKLAIIEADIMLGIVLANAGYIGNSIGDQLKSISPNTLKSVQDAWNAHKVRNQIAHEGADFILTQKMARDTIMQYQRVFQEFDAV